MSMPLAPRIIWCIIGDKNMCFADHINLIKSLTSLFKTHEVKNALIIAFVYNVHTLSHMPAPMTS